MKEYKFSEDSAVQTLKSRYFSRLPILLASFTVGIYLVYVKNGADFLSFKVLLLLFFLILFSLVLGGFLGIKMGKKMMMQTIYSLSDTGVVINTSSKKTFNIDFKSIESHKSIKTGLLITTSNQKYLIPSGLNDFEGISALIIKNINE